MSCHRSWPSQYVQAVQSGLDGSLLQQLLADAEAVAAAPNYWLPLSSIEGGPPRTAEEAAICHLYHTYVKQLLGPACQGAEYWVQVYEPGKGLKFHFDKDEQLLVATGRMVHPLLSSVLYLTGQAAAADQPRQGATVVMDQVFDSTAGCPVPEDPERTALVYPEQGMYCLFGGDLGHGVLDSTSAAQRVTMLINWWSAAPQGVQQATDGDLLRMGLIQPDALLPTCANQALHGAPLQQQKQQSNQPPADTQDPPGSAPGHSQQQSKPTARPEDSAADSCSYTEVPCAQDPQQGSSSTSDDTAAAVEALQGLQLAAGAASSAAAAGALPAGTSSSCGPPGGWLAVQLPGQMPCYHLDSNHPEGAQMVDQLLEGRVKLTGPDAVHLVSIDHRGALLYPLEPEDCLQAAEAMGCQANTVAAVVPCGMVESSEGDSDGSES